VRADCHPKKSYASSEALSTQQPRSRFLRSSPCLRGEASTLQQGVLIFGDKQGYTRGDVRDVDRVQFRVGFPSWFHRSPGGYLGLT